VLAIAQVCVCSADYKVEFHLLPATGSAGAAGLADVSLGGVASPLSAFRLSFHPPLFVVVLSFVHPESTFISIRRSDANCAV
jgi:hypothetical protein